MNRARKRSFRPETSGLEGRQLLSAAPGPMAGHVPVPGHAPIPHIIPIPGRPIEQNPVVPAAGAAINPPVTTFGDTSNAAPAMVQFRGKTLIAWSGDFNGSLNVAAITKGASGYQLTSKVTLAADLSPNLSPALAVYNGRLFMAWSDPNGHLNVICSADGVHFGHQVTLVDTSNTGPSLAVFEGRLYLGWKGGDGHMNVESSADGLTFSNKVTLLDTGGFTSPSLAAFDGRLYLAYTGTDGRLNIESSPDGLAFTNKVTLNQFSGDALALTVEQPAIKGRPARLVIGWTSSNSFKLNCMTSTNGQQFGGLMTSNQTGFKGLAIVSPSAGKLDFAWTGVQNGGRHLNFMQI
jgi:hypothetical protein